MKLRLILLVLSLLSVLSASAGGYFYYTSLREAAFNEAESQGMARVEIIRKSLAAHLSENVRPVRTLAGMREVKGVLCKTLPDCLPEVNDILDHFQKSLTADVCYLMDRRGNTIASSNRNDPDSFVGENFGFRPYFIKAISGRPASYMALGTTSMKRGAYHSYPVYDDRESLPVGVVVIKDSIQLIEKELSLEDGETVLVIDPRGVIFISNRQELLYKLLWKIPAEEHTLIAESRQFGEGPWPWAGFRPWGRKYVIDQAGTKYLMHRAELDNFPDWEILHLRSMKAISKKVSDPLIRITRPIIFTLCVLIGLSVFLLYRQASAEIFKRKMAEIALRESDERYRYLYNNTPAMLHSIDSKHRLVSVSNHWCDVMGYPREEVTGRRITDFFTESSKKFAEEVVFPDFFKKGYCKDVPYWFVKKNGEVIDILLSAIGDRDDKGTIIRSLAVSIDVTERNRAVEDLRRAKEKLSHYSKDLERQVSKRTRDITNILKYTPDVVYVKDREGRYVLVNSRFEELFGVRSEDIRGKTDYEISSKEVADQFRCHDQQVLEEGKSCQVEETVPHLDGMHTYLAVKFPVYDETGAPSGVCGISTDITAVKKAQDQLRRLSGSIMASQEKERSAIARELHDELGQILTALRLDTVWLLARLQDKDSKAAERALTMGSLIDQTIRDVRGIAIRLRPGVLDDLGLVDALEWFAEDFERRSGINCVFKSHKMPEINDTVATAAYRISQEALTNVARHASATRVDIVLEARDDVLHLSVVDNGQGFDAAGLSDFEGVGVAGMRERAILAGGSLEVESRIGEGTRIYLRVPIDKQNGGS